MRHRTTIVTLAVVGNSIISNNMLLKLYLEEGVGTLASMSL